MFNLKTKEEMQRINDLLLKASRIYYMGNANPIMTDREYDKLYDEVEKWEKETGITLDHSITHNVGYEVVSKLKKEPHEQKALSLNKTKIPAEVEQWANGYDVVLSWKLDGLTIMATYDDGKLTKAVTRGNGVIGENVTHNAPYFHGLPQTIPFKNHLVVRGEALISYATFKKINGTSGKYSVPRSLASGSVRQLDSKIASKRNINFKAFELVTPKTPTFSDNLTFLEKQGFDVVPHIKIKSKDIVKKIGEMEAKINDFGHPVDGLVFMIDDLNYAQSLGTTDKYPNYGLAFKWKDETYPTTIRKIEWQASRTGRINPVCIFDTIEIDGSQVSRATGNNLSFLADKGIGVGSVVEVYRANMVIPTVDRVVSNPQPLQYPSHCPSCHAPVQIRTGKDGSQVLICPNPDCPAKHLEHFVHFVSRDAMNIVGLAKNTLEMLIDEGAITNFADLYHIKEHKELVAVDGFGLQSFKVLCSAIEESRNTTLDRVLYSQGVEGIGRRVSKDIAKHCNYSLENFVVAMDSGYDWTTIDGVGQVLCKNIHNWWMKGNNRNSFLDLCNELNFEQPQMTVVKTANNKIAGKTFCVTGKVIQFANRKVLSQWIEERGGKLTGSVSSKTNYLVNNDLTSMSGKNKKAKELGIPIIDENTLLSMAS